MDVGNGCPRGGGGWPRRVAASVRRPFAQENFGEISVETVGCPGGRVAVAWRGVLGKTEIVVWSTQGAVFLMMIMKWRW